MGRMKIMASKSFHKTEKRAQESPSPSFLPTGDTPIHDVI